MSCYICGNVVSNASDVVRNSEHTCTVQAPKALPKLEYPIYTSDLNANAPAYVPGQKWKKSIN